MLHPKTDINNGGGLNSGCAGAQPEFDSLVKPETRSRPRRDAQAGPPSTGACSDNRHDQTQNGAYRRAHVADPVDQVQEGT